MIDPTTKATSTKPTGSTRIDAAQEFRTKVESSAAQAKETFERMSAITAEATEVITNSYSTGLRGVHDYNTKFLEFANTNFTAAFEFAKKLAAVKSHTDYIELSAEHSRQQIETLAEQANELAALAQKITLATAEPIKVGTAKAFSQARAA
jgi:phasin